MTQRDRWAQRPCVLGYWAYADTLRRACQREQWILPDSVQMQFFIPMPKSWPKKKRAAMELNRHQDKNRNDIDNLIKGVLDALRPNDDSGVWRVLASKRWAVDGLVILEVLR